MPAPISSGVMLRRSRATRRGKPVGQAVIAADQDPRGDIGQADPERRRFSIRSRDDDQIGPVADRAGHGVGEEAALYGWGADALMGEATTSDHARRLITGARVLADAGVRCGPTQRWGGEGGR